MSLEPRHVEHICKKVHKKFPELRDVSPRVSTQAAPKAMSPTRRQLANKQFLLTFRGSTALPGGKTMQRVVRVVANEKGKVLKLAVSK